MLKKWKKGLFKNTVFRSAALDFFHRPDFFCALYPTLEIKKNLTKNPLNYYSLKVKTPPPPSLLKVKKHTISIFYPLKLTPQY